MSYLVWTDGAYSIPKRAGGYAFMAQDVFSSIEYRVAGRFTNSTSQRAELLAIIAALDYLPICEDVTIFTDSMYAVEGLAGNWTLKANLDLWEQLKFWQEYTHYELIHIPRCSTPEHKRVDAAAKAVMYKKILPGRWN